MPEPPSIYNAAAELPRADLAGNDYMQPTFGHGLRIWWAIFWKVQLISGVLDVLLRAWVMYLYRETTLEAHLLRPALLAGPFVIQYSTTLMVMYFVLRKTFRSFRLQLTLGDMVDGSEPASYTWGRVARVWFAYSWRTLIYGLIAAFVVGFPTGALLGAFSRMPAVYQTLQLLVGTIVNGAVGLFVIYTNVIDEKFGDFRVSLLPRQTSSVTVQAAALPTAANL
jgi:hypothetical protein